MSPSEKIKGWKRILLFIIPYFFIVGLLQFFGAHIIGLNLANQGFLLSTLQQVLLSFCSTLGLFYTLFLFMKFVDNEPFINLGFHFQKRSSEIFLGILSGFFIIGSAFWILIFLEQIIFIKINLLIEELFLTILLFLLVAFAEETLFRGYILRNLMDSFNRNLALLISALLFTLAHAFNPNLNWMGCLNLFLAGILLGLPYIFSKNLWFPIALHFSWNFFQSFFGFNISGQPSYSLIEISMVEKNIINGGNFGIEGSILALILQVVFIFLVLHFISCHKVRGNNTGLPIY